MARFSFDNVPLAGKKPPRRKPGVVVSAVPTPKPANKPPKPAKKPFTLSIDAIARMIDPEAWAEPPSADAGHLTSQLEGARAEIAALRDELEWLDIVPTTPEGEAQQIERERRKSGQRYRFKVPAHDATIPERAVERRRKAALSKAKVIFDACSKVLGRRNTLTIVHGGGKTRYFRRKSGL